MQNKNIDETEFTIKVNNPNYTSPTNITYYIFHTIMSIIALLLAVTCNKDFSIISIIVSLFFPYAYIIYSLIHHKGICLFQK